MFPSVSVSFYFYLYPSASILFSWIEDGEEFVLYLYRPHTFPQGPVIYRSPKTHLERVQSRVGERNSWSQAVSKPDGSGLPATVALRLNSRKTEAHRWWYKKLRAAQARDAKSFGSPEESTQAWTFLAHLLCVASHASGCFGAPLGRHSFPNTGAWAPAYLSAVATHLCKRYSDPEVTPHNQARNRTRPQTRQTSRQTRCPTCRNRFAHGRYDWILSAIYR